MKLKPALLLIVLALASVAFLSYLLNEAEKQKVCCREKPQASPKTGDNEEIPVSSIKHLIASNL